MQNPFVFPMAIHVAWKVFLYALLTIARAPAVWGIGRRADGSNPWATLEPRIGANLRNQFEWPLLFYIACLLLIQQGAASHAAAVLAWIFVGGRLLHGAVQILTTNVRLRGLVFMVNFLAVLGLWALIVQAAAARG